MTLAIFGISNSALNLAVNLIVLFLVVVWFALIYWTYSDAKRRLEDPVLIACATGASLFPYLGTIIYTILRPPEYLEDQHERDLEIRATELRVRQLTEQSCPHCSFPIEKNFIRCPSCRRRVKDPCASCSKPLDPRWGVCPYCEAEVVRRQPQQQAKGARRPAQQGRQAAPRKAAAPGQAKQTKQTKQPAQRKAQPRQGQKRAARPAAAPQRPRTPGQQTPSQGGGSSRPAPTS